MKKNTIKLIVGTIPPPRFTTGDLLERDVDFCYGSHYNSLWLYIDKIHSLDLLYENSHKAVVQRKNFLSEHKIGICDIVECCEREKIDASDLGMKNIKLRDLMGYLKQFPKIETLLFIGGNSKNGPEYFFRKHLREHHLELELVSDEIPRIHQFVIPNSWALSPRAQSRGRENRTIKTVSLTSSSGSANRAIGSMPLYQQLKSENPDFNTFEFRVMQYKTYL